MLYLIGIGTKKEHLTFEMLDVIRGSSEVFLEYYTCFYEDSFEELEKYFGRSVVICGRKQIEENVEEMILFKARENDVALLIIGDVFAATTHISLLVLCRKLGVETKVYHNVSVVNLVSRTGLQLYKFGKVTSIPFHNEKFMPKTPLLVYHENCSINAHTLFLLDLNPLGEANYLSEESFLTAFEALNFLLEMSKQMELGSSILEGQEVVLCSRLGFSDEVILYGKISEIISLDRREEFKPPLCVVIPSKLHSVEEEFLEQFRF